MKNAALISFCLLLAAPAGAYEPETHAGLTERAALASRLQARLRDDLGRPLGLLEPLRLALGDESELARRLARLDPEGGFAPEDGRQAALGWLVAGAVLEGEPAERVRHHFFDPRSGRGLDQADGAALRTRIRAATTGLGTLRGIFTGGAFDATGRPAPEWALGAEGANEWGLPRFLDELERAGSAPRRADRDDALCRALLAAGAVLRVLESMGDPSFVRNDFRISIDEAGAPYQRYVARRYGRSGVPAPSPEGPQPRHLVDLFRDGKGNGLAERTQRRYFSLGTLPGSGAFPHPRVDATIDAPSGYLEGDGVEALARWERTAGGVRWSLDERTHRAYARALLPEIGAYARAALDHLFRATVAVEPKRGQLVATLDGAALKQGVARLYGDDPRGQRKLLGEVKLGRKADGAELASWPRPAGVKHVAVVLRGEDTHGEPLVVVKEADLR